VNAAPGYSIFENVLNHAVEPYPIGKPSHAVRVCAGKLDGMKRKYTRLAEVQLDPPRHASSPALLGPGAAFTVQLPAGAAIAVPAGFDPAELFILLTVVREAWQ